MELEQNINNAIIFFKISVLTEGVLQASHMYIINTLNNTILI